MDLGRTLTLEFGEAGIGETVHVAEARSRVITRPVIKLCIRGRFQSSLRGSTMAIERPPPMRFDALTPEMPGLFSTQSVDTQGAGFSQASQIHKRDEHIRGQSRFVEHKRFNESFLMNASTSPFYPLFASLDVNAKVHEGKAGEMLWDRCIELGGRHPRFHHAANKAVRMAHEAARLAHQLNFPRPLQRDHAKPLPC